MEQMQYQEPDGVNTIGKSKRMTIHKIGKDLKIGIADLRKILTNDACLFQEDGKYRYPVESDYEAEHLHKWTKHSKDNDCDNKDLTIDQMKMLYQDSGADENLMEFIINKYTKPVIEEVSEKETGRQKQKNQTLIRFNKEFISITMLTGIINARYIETEEDSNQRNLPATFEIDNYIRELRTVPCCDAFDKKAFIDDMHEQGFLDTPENDDDNNERQHALSITSSSELIALTNWRSIVGKNAVNVLAK